MLNKELFKYQDKLYYVFKKLRQSQIKEGYINDVKERWNCNLVVRSRQQNDDTLIFLIEIEEATIVS
jgi:hypothetical protein